METLLTHTTFWFAAVALVASVGLAVADRAAVVCRVPSPARLRRRPTTDRGKM